MGTELSGSRRSTHIAIDLALPALAGQTAARVRMARLSHRAASLDIEKHADFRIAGQHRRIFTGVFVALFLLPQSNLRDFHIVSEKKPFCIASDLGVCDSNRIAHRGGIGHSGTEVL